MKGFIEYTDDVAGKRTIIAVSMIMAITENGSGKAVIYLKDRVDIHLIAVETYDEIRSRLDACMQEANT